MISACRNYKFWSYQQPSGPAKYELLLRLRDPDGSARWLCMWKVGHPDGPEHDDPGQIETELWDEVLDRWEFRKK